VKQTTRRLAPWALIAGLVGPLLIFLGAALTHFHLIDYRIGLELMTLKLAWWASLVGGAFALLVLVLSLGDLRRSGALALIGVVAAGAAVYGLWRFNSHYGASPPVHDVSTDWSDPVMFSKAVVADRASSGAPNRIEADPRVPADAGAPWAGMRVAEVNAKTCPGAQPIPKGVDPDRVVEALKGLGVQTTGAQPFRVEGVHDGLWFGLEDDIAVRIRPDRTDIRSTSRSMANDYGANCRRVTQIVQALSK
jgi:fatty-acyl-CoA synthase